MEKVRIEWTETRQGELFLMIAESAVADQWEFWERQTWEPSWYRTPATPRLLERLQVELSQKSKVAREIQT